MRAWSNAIIAHVADQRPDGWGPTGHRGQAVPEIESLDMPLLTAPAQAIDCVGVPRLFKRCRLHTADAQARKFSIGGGRFFRRPPRNSLTDHIGFCRRTSIRCQCFLLYILIMHTQQALPTRWARKLG